MTDADAQGGDPAPADTPQVDGSPSVLAQGAEALGAFLSELSEGPAGLDPEVSTITAVTAREDGEATSDDDDTAGDEWHDLEFDFNVPGVFDAAQRAALLAEVRHRVRERVRAQLTPRHILLRDKVTFTLGTLDLLASAYWLGASPTTFYKLYTVKAVVLLGIRWIYYRAKRWHYYLFDLCYAVQVLLLANLWVWPQSVGLAKVAFAFALGPLLWSIIAFRNSLVYHSLDKVTSLFLHFFPACVAWAHRFHPPPALAAALAADAELRGRWEAGSAWELCVLPMGPYLLWAVLYGLKIFVISSQRIAERNYETLFKYSVESKKGVFAAVVLRFPRKLQPVAYLAMHMALTQVVMGLNTVWWRSERAALGFIVAAFVVAVWHGASYYFEIFAHRYLAGLGIEPRQRRGGGAPAPAMSGTSG